MTDHIEVVGIFATPIYFAICDSDISDSIDYLENSDLDDMKDSEVLEKYGTISKDTHILRNNECNSLNNFIQKHLNNYCRNVLAWDYRSISITQSWVSIKSQNQEHIYHKHPNSLVSGVFYWQDDIADLSFMKPEKRTNFLIERNRNIVSNYAWDYHNFSPKKNTLILFPSETQHGVPLNSSDIPRKSLAFNTMIFEKIGITDELSELDLRKSIDDY